MKTLLPLLLFALPLATLGQVHDLLIVSGQSNAVGYDAYGKDFVSDFSDQDVRFWYRCGDPPPDEFDVGSKGWTFLRSQPKGSPMPKGKMGRQYGNYSHASGGFGPEVGMARSIQKGNQRPVAVLKVAFSGTRVDEWLEDGPCYKAFKEEYNKAMAGANEAGFELRPRAFVWVQGESDANAKLAPTYSKRLTELITNLRRDIDAPELPALVAVNERFGSDRNKHMPKIIEQQQATADALPNCVRVDTSKATIANGAHWDAKGTLAVGKWFANALRELEKKS